jgi:hypothetical protein
LSLSRYSSVKRLFATQIVGSFNTYSSSGNRAEAKAKDFSAFSKERPGLLAGIEASILGNRAEMEVGFGRNREANDS